MKIMQQNVVAKDVMSMIDNRLAAVTTAYHYSQSKDDKMTAEAMAETKWQLAELKMQFCDLLVKQLRESPENITTN